MQILLEKSLNEFDNGLDKKFKFEIFFLLALIKNLYNS